MLSSSGRFLWWARQSRAREASPTSFRALAQNWKPVVAPKAPAPVFEKRAGRRIDPNRPRPAWSPWLWVK